MWLDKPPIIVNIEDLLWKELILAAIGKQDVDQALTSFFESSQEIIQCGDHKYQNWFKRSLPAVSPPGAVTPIHFTPTTSKDSTMSQPVSTNNSKKRKNLSLPPITSHTLHNCPTSIEDSTDCGADGQDRAKKSKKTHWQPTTHIPVGSFKLKIDLTGQVSEFWTTCLAISSISTKFRSSLTKSWTTTMRTMWAYYFLPSSKLRFIYIVRSESALLPASAFPKVEGNQHSTGNIFLPKRYEHMQIDKFQ